MACNESLDFQQAISHALQRLPTPSMVFQNFQLSSYTLHSSVVIVERYIRQSAYP